MANAHYAKGKEKILSGAVNYPTDTIKVALVKNTYPQNLATDEFFGPISAYVVGTPQTLVNKSVVAGAFDADDVTFLAVTAGDTLEGVVIYKDTGVAGTSPLLVRALHQLNQSPPAGLADESPSIILDWAVRHWARHHLTTHPVCNAAD